MAVGLTPSRLLAVAVDGRGPDDAGVTLPEFAVLLCELGAVVAMNLDGGSSAALIAGAELCNTPRSDTGEPLDGGGPLPTAIVFARRL
jgi:exopolysaccharide biosynthesis protein